MVEPIRKWGTKLECFADIVGYIVAMLKTSKDLRDSIDNMVWSYAMKACTPRLESAWEIIPAHIHEYNWWRAGIKQSRAEQNVHAILGAKWAAPT